MSAASRPKERPLDSIEEALAGALVEALPSAIDRLAALGGPRAYSVAEVADRLAISETMVRKLIHAGQLPTVPHLVPYKVSALALAAFMAGRSA